MSGPSQAPCPAHSQFETLYLERNNFDSNQSFYITDALALPVLHYTIGISHLAPSNLHARQPGMLNYQAPALLQKVLPALKGPPALPQKVLHVTDMTGHQGRGSQ